MEKIKNYIISAVAIVVLIGSHCVLAKESRKKYLEQEVSKVAIDEIASTGTPSVQVAIGLGDEVIYEGAFGHADIEHKIEATPASRYRTDSVAKWFTA